MTRLSRLNGRLVDSAMRRRSARCSVARGEPSIGSPTPAEFHQVANWAHSGAGICQRSKPSSPAVASPRRGTLMNPRKKLADILLNSECETLGRIRETTKAAEDLKPLPSGEYRCIIASGELFNAKSGTPGYKLKLVVVQGEHVDRVVWHDLWLSEAALPMTKRDLRKLEITSPEQLERPLPEGILVNVKVALRKNDDGTEFNRVTRLDVVDIESPEPEPFAPSDEPADGSTVDAAGFDWAAGQQNGASHE